MLQGYGVTVDLVGTTFISKHGITSSTFKTVPDVPVGSFELTLPEGPLSALAANGNLCDQSLVMPTQFISQSGVVLNQETHIDVEGCSNTLSVVSKKLKSGVLTLQVGVPAAGTLRVSGKDVSSGSKSSGGRGTVTVKLRVSRHGKTRVRLSFTPSKKGKRLVKVLAVRL